MWVNGQKKGPSVFIGLGGQFFIKIKDQYRDWLRFFMEPILPGFHKIGIDSKPSVRFHLIDSPTSISIHIPMFYIVNRLPSTGNLLTT